MLSSESDSTGLCGVCSTLVLEPKERRPDQQLGAYEEILKRSKSTGSGRAGCTGCAFFCDVLHTSNNWEHRRSELPGHIVFLHSLRLDVREPGKEGNTAWAVDDLLFDICREEGVQDPDPLIDSLRPGVLEARDDRCFDLIRSWLDACSSHDNCVPPVAVSLPKRVIEIPADDSQPPKLRATHGELGQYVALSHCWGSLGIVKLKDSLIPQFQEAIPVLSLPKNFVDAIYITRRLGFRYLWIDALCISQDNAAEWVEEAPKMSYYYGQAALMISATTPKDSDGGILHERHVPYSPAFGSGEKRYCLRQRLLRWDWDINKSPLAGRGWPAQERILAPRVVHYTRRQLIWECAAGFQFEVSGIDDKVVGAGQVDQRFRKQTLQPLVTEGLKGLQQSIPSREIKSFEDNEVIAKAPTAFIPRLRAWHQCVDEYSGRMLTLPSDKLQAMSGLAAIMNYDGEMGEYLAGIWSNKLAAGLSWGRPWALLTSPPSYRAPSWSWASVDGEISCLMLSSPAKFLEPPIDEISQAMAAKYDPQLIKNGIILQDESNPYGPVKAGSHIVVEGACITEAQLMELNKAIFGEDRGGLVIGLDKSNKYDCPCCGEKPGVEAERSLGPKKPVNHHAPFDLCMAIAGDAWVDPQGFVDMLLLRWVDQEQRAAERVGFTRMKLWKQEEELETFRQAFDDGGWKRLSLTLF
ncbi:HET-domain-containing protein [Thozetella sp. PMI_491]|nr:HET-domain-containing protein [Thozetella sp. PMI_491]